MTLFEVSYIVLWALVLVMGVAIYALYYHFGEMYLSSREGRATQGPAVGEQLRAVQARPLEGSTLEFPRKDRRTVLLFSAPSCTVCNSLLGDLAADGVTDILDDLIAVSSGTREEAEKWLSVLPSTQIVIDPHAGIRARYGIGVTPFAVAVDDAGRVRMRGVVSNASNVRELAMQARTEGVGAVPVTISVESKLASARR